MITLYKGDDTHGQLGKKCVVRFHCDDVVDMDGVTVKFNLLNIVTKEFENVNDGDELEVFVSHIESRKLPLGIVYGKLWGEDSSGKIRTFANRIPFCVTMDLRKVYGSDGLDSVDVHVYASVEWGAIANKPTLFPSKVSMVEGLEEALKQAGKVKTVNDQSPDENGNIEIEIPSCKVTSVNNKTGDVELTAQDIPYGGEGASNVETAIELNTQAAVDNAEAIDSLEEQVGELHTNTYTKSEVDDKINQFSAHYLTTLKNGRFVPFGSHAELEEAKSQNKFYYDGALHTPDKNDYLVILADESVRVVNPPTTRYAYVGVWPTGRFQYQYTINEAGFSQEQWDAINSKATADKIAAIAGKLSADDVDPRLVSGIRIAVIGGKPIYAPEGRQITLDDEPSENSNNGVKSKGIWSWVKGLFGKLATVAISGSYNDLTDKPTIPEGADVITLDGQRVIKNGTEEITTYTNLLALVCKGGVVLLDTVAGTIAKEALFHPHMADETAIRFDATGTLGEKVYTRSFAFTPKTDGGIAVSRGDLTEVAKKADIPTSMPWGSVTDKPSVFPPESHSHESTEIKVKDGENELPLVVAPSSSAKTGQAADAYDTGRALPLFFDSDPAKSVFRIGEDSSEPVLEQINYNVRYHFPALVEGDVFLASVSQLADKLTDDDLKTLCTTCGISLTKPDGTPKTRAELLIDLFGESNSQLAKTIEDKAAIVLTIEKRTDDAQEFFYHGDTKLDTFAKLYQMVATGRVIVKATATQVDTSSPVWFRPHMFRPTKEGSLGEIRFDATGTIKYGGKDHEVTRNIQAEEVAGGGYNINDTALTEMATKTYVDGIVGDIESLLAAI